MQSSEQHRQMQKRCNAISSYPSIDLVFFVYCSLTKALDGLHTAASADVPRHIRATLGIIARETFEGILLAVRHVCASGKTVQQKINILLRFRYISGGLLDRVSALSAAAGGFDAVLQPPAAKDAAVNTQRAVFMCASAMLHEDILDTIGDAQKGKYTAGIVSFVDSALPIPRGDVGSRDPLAPRSPKENTPPAHYHLKGVVAATFKKRIEKWVKERVMYKIWSISCSLGPTTKGPFWGADTEKLSEVGPAPGLAGGSPGEKRRRRPDHFKVEDAEMDLGLAASGGAGGVTKGGASRKTRRVQQ